MTVLSPIALLLGLCFPERHAIKRVARAAGCSERSVEDYRAGRADMPSRRLLALMAQSEAMEAQVIALVREQRRLNAGQNGCVDRVAAAQRRAADGANPSRAVVAVDGAGAGPRAAAEMIP